MVSNGRIRAPIHLAHNRMLNLSKAGKSSNGFAHPSCSERLTNSRPLRSQFRQTLNRRCRGCCRRMCWRNYEVSRSFPNTCAVKYRIEGGTPALENDIGHPLRRWPPHVTEIVSIRTSSSGRTRLPEESRVQTRPSRDPPEDCQAAPQAFRWQFPRQVFDWPN
jgi:hypothetical protein